MLPRGGALVQIHINDNSHMLEIWLTRQEKDDATLRASLAPVLSEYKARKYLPVFFMSGEADLQESTAELLRSRRRRMSDMPV